MCISCGLYVQLLIVLAMCSEADACRDGQSPCAIKTPEESMGVQAELILLRSIEAWAKAEEKAR